MTAPADTSINPPAIASPTVGALAVPLGHRRMRWATVGAFTLLAAATLLQGGITLRLEAARASDAAVLDQAGLQRGASQRAGDLASMLAQAADDPVVSNRHIDELDALMRQAGIDALVMENDLKRQMAGDAEAGRRLQPALAAWQAARERLWYRSHLLLRLDAEAADNLRRAAAAVRAESAPAAMAAQRLHGQVRQLAEQRADELQSMVRWGIGAMLGLLLVLALFVVEPAARAVRRHGRALRGVAQEMQRLALVAEHTSALIVIMDREGRALWANPAFYASTGSTPTQVIGTVMSERLQNSGDASAVVRSKAAVAAGTGFREDLLVRAADGSERWIDVDMRPLHDDHGTMTGFVSVATDITARVRQQEQLEALLAVLPAGVVVHGAHGEVLQANRAAESLLGLSLAQLHGAEPLADGWQALRADGSGYPGTEHPALRTLQSGLALRSETMGVQLAPGERRWLLVNTEPQRDRLGQLTGVVTCFSDVTEIRLLNDRISEGSRVDALTRLPNRTVVMERLTAAIEHARRHPGYGFAVLFMDFDRFKQVNDTLGHAAGDELLRQIAQRLTLALRPGDALARMEAQVAARLGGDEFVVVLEGISNADTLANIASRLLQEVGEPYLIGCNPVQSSASIGVVLCADPADADAPPMAAEDILRDADTAMYEAKRAGRGRWVMFDRSMHERVVRLLAVERDLRRALKEDELFVVYQPVIEFSTGAMCGVEALVRWRHPSRGLISPVEFIGVAEECGLIDAVGSFVMERACRQFMQWQQTLGRAAPAQLAVNLSRAQLLQPAIVDDVQRVLHTCGMEPAQLQFEVTESLAAQDDRVLVTLRELKALGVRLALDDFGTGYSSLACLHQMPVDTVKIDRSFVQHAQTVEYHRVLIEATIRVARTLGMQTVAEGIETEGQAELMRELACDRGQGYLYSRPHEAADFEHWARARLPVAGRLSAPGSGDRQSEPSEPPGQTADFCLSVIVQR